ncbi:hypothetical protein EMPS_06148 [Entomortierella parvispora]|uniref:HMG box domain-containing protein n=1 Tax=Entomortierella parvispora TaxID=205924 RepID=A0A9P3HC41_9FUNG|nr:hypothetical protein EMPS_06148 [Entomortierella parvispora]
MAHANVRAQYPIHGSGSLFTASNSSLSSICSANSYDMSSLASSPASSTSSLPLSQFNSNKTLPALPVSIGSDFSQQRKRYSSIPPSTFQQHRGLSSPLSPSTPRSTSYKIPNTSRKQTTIDSTKIDTPKKIPRPPNSFMIYRREQAALHRGLMASQLSMILGKKWEAEPEERKAHFARLARLAQEEHARRYPEYKFMPARRGTGKKAQMQAARKATAAGFAGGYFASTTSTSISPMHSNPFSQPAPSTLAAYPAVVEKDGLPLPVLLHHGEAQTQLLPSEQRVAPPIYSPPTPTPTYTSMPTSHFPSSLFFDPFATPGQIPFLPLYNTPASLIPSDPLASDNICTLESQPPSMQIPTMYSFLYPSEGSPQRPCPPLIQSSSLPSFTLSQSLADGGVLNLSWETPSQFEGTPPTQSVSSQTYIAKAFESCPGPTPSHPSIASSEYAMPAYSFQPVTAALSSLPPSLTTLAVPVWTSGPLSNGIMMENGTVQSPTLPYCSSLSSSASSSFSELSPFFLLNTPLNDPTIPAGQGKECFYVIE